MTSDAKTRMVGLARTPDLEDATQKLLSTMPSMSVIGVGIGCVFTRQALYIVPGLKDIEWAAILDRTFRMYRSSLWYLGDALVYGENAYGEEFAAWVSEYAPGTQANAMSLARRFPPDKRIPSEFLTFSHYQEVAMLPDAEAMRLLEKAHRQELTTSELRIMSKTLRGLPLDTKRTRELASQDQSPNGAVNPISQEDDWIVSDGSDIWIKDISEGKSGTFITWRKASAREVYERAVEPWKETLELARTALKKFIATGEQHVVSCSHSYGEMAESHMSYECNITGCNQGGRGCSARCLMTRNALAMAEKLLGPETIEAES